MMFPDENYPFNYYLSATHKWSMPGVRCSNCGCRCGTVGLAYPSIDLPDGIDPKPYEDVWPVSPERIRELTAILRPLIPRCPIHAGTEFGPLIGKGWGKFGDFTWLNSSTPLVFEKALDKLRASGMQGLSVVKPQIQLRFRKDFHYFELEVLPGVHLAPACDPCSDQMSCSECGFNKPRSDGVELLYEDIQVQAESFPGGLYLSRIQEWPGVILASEKFVYNVKRLELSDVCFREVTVIY